MKKLLLLSCAFALTMGAQAGVVKGAVNMPNRMKAQHVSLVERAASDQATVAKKAAKKVAAKADQPITDTPDGKEFKNMYVTSEAYGMGWGDIYYQMVDGGMGDVVEGTDGNLYVSGPISQAYIWALGTPYIKLTKGDAEGTYVMATPQCYAIDYGDPYYIQRLKFDESEGTYVVDETNTSVTFKWENNVLTQVDDCFFGLTDATGDWFYMADSGVKYVVNTDEVNVVPDGAPSADYRMTYNDDPEDLTSTSNRMVALVGASDAQSQYLTFMEDNLPEAAVEVVNNQKTGKKDIYNPQYMGTDEEYMSHVYALTGNAKVTTTQDGYVYFNYDQTNSMVMENTSTGFKAEYPASIIINCGKNNLYIIDEYVAPVFETVADDPMVPADPVMDKVTESMSWDSFKFTIPTVDVEGNELNVNKLSYVVYYNNDVYTFDPSLFVGLTAPMTEIPYGFSDTNYDIWHSSSTGSETIYFYDQGYKKLGIQSIYRGGNQENRSNVVYYYRTTSGVDDLNAQVRTIKSESYYNAAGQQINGDAAGFIIKRVEYTDGTVETYKVKK